MERREIAVRTAFGGPGARDAFECVAGAVSDGRYVVEPALARPERGFALERFVFALRHRDRAVALAARPGTVTDEFVALARREERTAAAERGSTRSSATWRSGSWRCRPSTPTKSSIALIRRIEPAGDRADVDT